MVAQAFTKRRLVWFLFPILVTMAGSLAWGADDVKVTIEPRTKPTDEKAADSSLDRRPGSIRIDTTLVQVNVTVTDPLNRFVTGLEKEHFRLFEDKVEQKISEFSSEDAPLSVGLVFDTSGSMGSKLQKSREAVAQFLKTANPEDEFFLIEFNDRPQMVVPFTTDTDQVQNQLTFTQSKGRTALLDGIYMAMNTMKKAQESPQSDFDHFRRRR